MNKNIIKSYLGKVSRETLEDLLDKLITVHLDPAFGASKLIEHEVAVFEVLQNIKFLSDSPDEYELGLNLRMTKAKARNLLYQVELRRLSGVSELEKRLIDLISNPLIDTTSSKRGDSNYWILEVYNPVVMDALKSRIRKLGFVSDGSFSPTIAKIPKQVFPFLITDLIPPHSKDQIIKELKEKGFDPEGKATAQELFSGMLVKLGEKAMGEAGAVFGKEIGESLADLMKTGATHVFTWLESSGDKR